MPQGPTDRQTLDDLRQRIKQLEDINSKQKLDSRFAGIEELIRKGDAQNAGEITAIKRDVSGMTERQSAMLKILQNNQEMISGMQGVIQKGIALQTVIDGQLGPVVRKPLGSTFRLNRSLIE